MRISGVLFRRRSLLRCVDDQRASLLVGLCLSDSISILYAICFSQCVLRCVLRHVFLAVFFTPCVCAVCFTPCVSRHVFRAMCFALCVLRHASPLRVFRHVASCFASAALLSAFAPPSCVSASARSFCVGDLLGALLWRWSDVRHLSRLPLDIAPSGRRSASRLFYGDACLTVFRRRRSSMTPLL